MSTYYCVFTRHEDEPLYVAGLFDVCMDLEQAVAMADSVTPLKGYFFTIQKFIVEGDAPRAYQDGYEYFKTMCVDKKVEGEDLYRRGILHRQ